jgi:hypothetical protein
VEQVLAGVPEGDASRSLLGDDQVAALAEVCGITR